MANIVETRLIYTSGVYKFSQAMRNCRRILVLIDILRNPPFQIYANEKSNPAVYFLGYYTLWIGDYVYEKKPIEFTEQCIIHYENPGLQLLNNLLAVGTQVASVIQALGSVMTPPAPLIIVQSPDPEFEGCPYTWIKFKLPFGTRIQVTVLGTLTQEFPGAQAFPAASDPIDEVPRYPVDRPRSEDPVRSEPYEDESPGDTAIATPEDPDLGIVAVVCTLTFEVRVSDQPNYLDYVSVVVPNNTYNAPYVDITGYVGNRYLYYSRVNGSAGVITLGGPYDPLLGVVISYSNVAVNCV